SRHCIQAEDGVRISVGIGNGHDGPAGNVRRRLPRQYEILTTQLRRNLAQVDVPEAVTRDLPWSCGHGSDLRDTRDLQSRKVRVRPGVPGISATEMGRWREHDSGEPV